MTGESKGPAIQRMHQRRRRSLLLLALLLLLPAAGTTPLRAQSLAISPPRLIFEGRKRTAEITLINRSPEAETYRIYFKQARMTEEGQLENIVTPEPGGMYADALVRYAPRQVTVPPNGVQTVRLALRVPRDLPAGEYRSHLVFRSVPKRDAGNSVEASKLKPNELLVQMIRIFEFTMPVIVRHGQLTATTSLSDPRIEPGDKPKDPPQLVLMLHREGNRSVYGDLHITFVPAGGGEPTEIGLARAVAIYTSVTKRKVKVPLHLPDGFELRNGRLGIELRQYTDSDTLGKVLATSELSLP
jgi:P pilus assembly chaperone PapD